MGVCDLSAFWSPGDGDMADILSVAGSKTCVAAIDGLPLDCFRVFMILALSGYGRPKREINLTVWQDFCHPVDPRSISQWQRNTLRYNP